MKSPQAFRSIGEVARLVGVATHVLRYWETQFPALAPVRRPDGRRYYRPDDLLLAAGLCDVLREDGLTIRGARRLIDMDKGAALRERGRLRLHATLDLTKEGGKATRRTNGERRKAADGERPPQHVDHHGMSDGAAFQTQGGVPGSTEQIPAEMIRPASHRDKAYALPADMDGSRWLARLTGTAALLRGWSAELPPAVRPLAQALRAARQRRS